MTIAERIEYARALTDESEFAGASDELLDIWDPPRVERDLEPGKDFATASNGWDFVCGPTRREVFKAWSTSISHGPGHPFPDGIRRFNEGYVSASQRGRKLFSTKALAEKALYRAIVDQAIRQLQELAETMK